MGHRSTHNEDLWPMEPSKEILKGVFSTFEVKGPNTRILISAKHISKSGMQHGKPIKTVVQC